MEVSHSFAGKVQTSKAAHRQVMFMLTVYCRFFFYGGEVDQVTLPCLVAFEVSRRIQNITHAHLVPG